MASAGASLNSEPSVASAQPFILNQHFPPRLSDLSSSLAMLSRARLLQMLQSPGSRREGQAASPSLGLGHRRSIPAEPDFGMAVRRSLVARWHRTPSSKALDKIRASLRAGWGIPLFPALSFASSPCFENSSCVEVEMKMDRR